MDFDSRFDENLNSIKRYLQAKGLKLWLTPYFVDDKGRNDEELRCLAKNISKEIEKNEEICYDGLLKLQEMSLENINERKHYTETGYATIKIKISKQNCGQLLSINIKLSENVSGLQRLVSIEVGVTDNQLKFICKGKVLQGTVSLESQGIKHGMQIMAVIMEDNIQDVCASESRVRVLEEAREALDLLTRQNNDEDPYLQITDQKGNVLALPKAEKHALVVAMTLHEKGRAAAKQEDFSLALVLLLEAEKEFSRCNSNILKSVDNYALLSLDIAWCYLNLESLTQLPQAVEKLKQCESNFHQSYGPNLERLIALKGTSGNEAVLFMRLHLIQAIVLYHQNKIEEAKILLARAENELNSLKVDDGQMSHLIELGYQVTEARLALRACKSDVTMGVNWIENRRAEKKKQQEMEAERKKMEAERKLLGKCMDGNWIQPEYHKALLSMGYSQFAAKWALAQTNNDVNASITLIQDHPELYMNQQSEIIPNDIMEQVIQMGFDRQQAENALKKHKNIGKAIEELVKNNGIIDFLGLGTTDGNHNQPSTSRMDKQRKELEAFHKLTDGISRTEDDHLDLTLTSEEDFLLKYKQLINK